MSPVQQSPMLIDEDDRRIQEIGRHGLSCHRGMDHHPGNAPGLDLSSGLHGRSFAAGSCSSFASAAAPRLHGSHDEILQTTSASAVTASASKGDFRHSSAVLFTRKSAACRIYENTSLRRGEATVCLGVFGG